MKLDTSLQKQKFLNETNKAKIDALWSEVL